MSVDAETYLAAALSIAHQAADSQIPNLRRAAELTCDAFLAGHDLWVFGSGHAHVMAEEIYGRAGGLTCVRPILEPSLMLHESLLKSSLLERLPGLAATLLEVHPVAAGDVLVVASNSGRNAVPVEFALGARARGATVIALTSVGHSSEVASRAPSGKRLYEIADVVLDTRGLYGDAVLPNDPHPVGPTSTMVGAMLMQAYVVEVVGQMRARGKPVETLLSLNA